MTWRNITLLQHIYILLFSDIFKSLKYWSHDLLISLLLFKLFPALSIITFASDKHGILILYISVIFLLIISKLKFWAKVKLLL